MIDQEIEYLRQRAEAEALRALESRSSIAANAHNVLAVAYAERLDALEQDRMETQH